MYSGQNLGEFPGTWKTVVSLFSQAPGLSPPILFVVPSAETYCSLMSKAGPGTKMQPRWPHSQRVQPGDGASGHSPAHSARLNYPKGCRSTHKKTSPKHQVPVRTGSHQTEYQYSKGLEKRALQTGSDSSAVLDRITGHHIVNDELKGD